MGRSHTTGRHIQKITRLERVFLCLPIARREARDPNAAAVMRPLEGQ